MKIEIPYDSGHCIVIDDERLASDRESLSELDDVEPLRLVYAASRVVLLSSYESSSHTPQNPGFPDEILDAIDWERTAAQRKRLGSLGFLIAEAMDTSQRFAIGWPSAKKLIEMTSGLFPAGGFIAGAGTDHILRIRNRSEWIEGMEYQVRFIQSHGGHPILLPSLWVSDQHYSVEETVSLYRDLISRLSGPLFLHWLGAMFLKGVESHFPGDSFERILKENAEVVRGAKLSLLDPVRERSLRLNATERDQIIFTGDDLNFAELIIDGDGTVQRSTQIDGRGIALGNFSHALLGIFDGIKDPASLALRWLAHGETQRALEILATCQELSRWIFKSPTQYYKCGLAFLSWLDGAQDNFYLVNHEQTCRDRAYYLRTAELGAKAGVFREASLSADRLLSYLSLPTRG